jgi:Leucine-rich repeat (LRR) protein
MALLAELRLNGNGYEGDLPNNLHQMESLTHLDLSDNAFSGSIRTLFPANINDQVGFPTLETLILSNNDLSGEIPESSFRRMRNLETLAISGNPKLTGSLNEICKGSLMFGEADCETITCRCCQTGSSCPSF